jgi:transposase
MPEKIGSVTKDRYDAIVVEIRALLQQRNGIQFVIGDRALEIEPLQPRGGSHPARSEVVYSFTETLQMFADNAYTGLADWARNDLDLTFKVVRKPPNQVGFKVLPRRWIVERSLSWLMRARRNARDYERLPEHSEAHIT